MRQNSHDQENYMLPLKESTQKRRKKKKKKKKKKEEEILVTQNIHLQFSFNTNFSTLARHWCFNMQLLKTEQFCTITVCISAVRGGQYEKQIFWLVVGCCFSFSAVHVRLCYTDHSLVKVHSSPVLCTVLSHDTTVFLDCVLKPSFLPFFLTVC